MFRLKRLFTCLDVVHLANTLAARASCTEMFKIIIMFRSFLPDVELECTRVIPFF